MPTHNPENERIKRSYFIYLKEAKRLSEHSIDAAAAALNRFEEYTKYRDLKRFHIQQAVGFKRKLADQVSPRTGERLASATMFATLNALRAFFHWLAGQPGYRSHLTYANADYFALSEKEARVAKARLERPVPTMEQILHVVRTMPRASEIDLRNRALIAFTLLTGARDGAIASLKLKHVDIAEGRLVQDAREVRTKFSKTFTTWFFPVGEEIHRIVATWVVFLTTEKLFGPNDPLFPATQVVVGDDRCFRAEGLSRSGWSNATPIRKIFKEAFAGAGLAYANPHSFRKTLAQLGEQLCRTPEEFKAWSQNLGHEQVLTTFSSYGEVAHHRQAELKRHHPGHFAAVCALECTPREAAIRAGLIKVGASRYGGACDIVAAADLSERAQGRLLCDLFNIMSPNAQCTLIARMLEPKLGFGLAQRWRGEGQKKPPGS